MLALWIVWFVLTAGVISLAVFRKFAARKEDDYVHLADGGGHVIAEQVTVAQKLEKIDTWGKALTVVDVAFFLVLMGIVFFNAWHNTVDPLQQ